MHLPETDALFAYACAEMRPRWNGVKVSELQEAFWLATSPITLALVCICILAVWWRSIWIAILLNLLWLAWGGWHIFLSESINDSTFSAIQIDCIDSSTLFVGLGTAICVSTLIYTAWPKTRALLRR